MNRSRAAPLKPLRSCGPRSGAVPPYAAWFLGPVARAGLATLTATGKLGQRGETVAPGLMAFVVARHRWIDDALAASLARGVDQLLVLGAGYDTRAWRFADQLDGVAVFEVDHPATGRRKRRILAERADALPPVEVTHVEVDFQTQSLAERLQASGFAPGRRTFVVWEGVSMYLRRGAVQATLGTLSELTGPGSEVVMDLWYVIDQPSAAASALRASPLLLALVGEPITFGLHPDDLPGFVRPHGFSVEALARARDLESTYELDGRRVIRSVYVSRLCRRHESSVPGDPKEGRERSGSLSRGTNPARIDLPCADATWPILPPPRTKS